MGKGIIKEVFENMNKVILEGEVITSIKIKDCIIIGIDTGNNVLTCEVKDDLCEYVEIKNGERIRVLGRLEIIGTESVHGYGVIVDQIDFFG